ncbi:MAG: XRE family transcriptional regulator, partial [Chloroflexia bacterium]|nr:XRE family transcriptional regulator [Chloroflexia bacterium]
MIAHSVDKKRCILYDLLSIRHQALGQASGSRPLQAEGEAMTRRMTGRPPMAETIDHLIGQRLAHARAEAGLTLRELGARLNWDHSTLSSYETGRRSLSLPRLI